MKLMDVEIYSNTHIKQNNFYMCGADGGLLKYGESEKDSQLPSVLLRAIVFALILGLVVIAALASPCLAWAEVTTLGLPSSYNSSFSSSSNESVSQSSRRVDVASHLKSCDTVLYNDEFVCCEDGYYQCSLDESTFQNRELFEKHYLSHHGQPVSWELSQEYYKCSRHDTAYLTKSQYDAHISAYQGRDIITVLLLLLVLLLVRSFVVCVTTIGGESILFKATPEIVHIDYFRDHAGFSIKTRVSSGFDSTPKINHADSFYDIANTFVICFAFTCLMSIPVFGAVQNPGEGLEICVLAFVCSLLFGLTPSLIFGGIVNSIAEAIGKNKDVKLGQLSFKSFEEMWKFQFKRERIASMVGAAGGILLGYAFLAVFY